MSTSNLFFKGCFSELTDEQLQAIEAIGADGDLVDESCARETNTCGMTLTQLLNTYELYDFQRGVLSRKVGRSHFPLGDKTHHHKPRLRKVKERMECCQLYRAYFVLCRR